MFTAEKKIIWKKLIFRDADKALADFAKIIDKHFIKLDGLLDKKNQLLKMASL